MGRTPLIFLLLIVLIIKAYAVEVTVKSTELDEYYFGGEYVIFNTNIKPASFDDAVKLDGAEYELTSQLDSAGMFVEIALAYKKRILHPTPDDLYEKSEAGTTLKFYLPEGGGVKEINIKVFGYVPEISSRIVNLSVLTLKLNSEELLKTNITVVNKQKFYKDIKTLESELCNENDKKKLEEALMLYNDAKYWEAEAKVAEVEKSVAECRFEEKKNMLITELEELRDDLLDLQKKLIMLQAQIELSRDELKGYEELKSLQMNLSARCESVDVILDNAKRLINANRLDEAAAKLETASDAIKLLKLEVTKLGLKIESAKVERKNFLERFMTPYIAAAALIAVVAAVLWIRRRREKW